MHKYFISYVFSIGHPNHGFGNIETKYGKEIESMDDINLISRSIERDTRLKENSLVILHYIKLN